MLKDFKTFFSRIVQSINGFFPTHLLLLHLRKSYLFIAFWILLFGMVQGRILGNLGFSYLFVAPEYFEKINFFSFFFVGLCLGLFFMAFHISSYIYYSHRFPFLAAIKRPLYKFSVNNGIIPIVFLLFYLYHIVSFQAQEQFSFTSVLLDIFGLAIGIITAIVFVMIYFFPTIRVLDKLEKEIIDKMEKPLRAIIKQEKHLSDSNIEDQHGVRVYLNQLFALRKVRSVSHYPEEAILKTLQQHHLRAALLFLLTLLLLFLINLFSESDLFLIPAGASILLIMTMYLMVGGALYSWVKSWTIPLIIGVAILTNALGIFPFHDRIYPAYGLDYEVKPAEYSIENLKTMVNDSIVNLDSLNMIFTLNQWKTRCGSGQKQPFIIVNSSGGGMRSAIWTYGILRQLDSLSNDKFFDHLFCIFGSSGGMLGAAYYRSLFLTQKNLSSDEVQRKSSFSKMSRDLLNTVGFHLAIHDLLFPFRYVDLFDRRYPFDRGFAFDRQLDKNTDHIFKQRFSEYGIHERSGAIPMMVLSPTIVQDGRRLIIGNQGLSFLASHRSSIISNPTHAVDGVELFRLFENHKPKDLKFTTALRMSASFPYITPLTTLPTHPRIEVMDAGLRDNEGFDLSMRFIVYFKEWFADNVSEVIIIRIKADDKDEISTGRQGSGRGLSSLFKPIGGVFNSFGNYQHFLKANWLREADKWEGLSLNVHTFSLIEDEAPISLSWHLTEQERRLILNKIKRENTVQKLSEIASSCED